MTLKNDWNQKRNEHFEKLSQSCMNKSTVSNRILSR